MPHETLRDPDKRRRRDAQRNLDQSLQRYGQYVDFLLGQGQSREQVCKALLALGVELETCAIVVEMVAEIQHEDTASSPPTGHRAEQEQQPAPSSSFGSSTSQTTNVPSSSAASSWASTPPIRSRCRCPTSLRGTPGSSPPLRSWPGPVSGSLQPWPLALEEARPDQGRLMPTELSRRRENLPRHRRPVVRWFELFRRRNNLQAPAHRLRPGGVTRCRDAEVPQGGRNGSIVRPFVFPRPLLGHGRPPARP
jgi:hypothetical protein